MGGREVTFAVNQDDAGERLDRLLRDRVSDLSRTQGQRLIEAGKVTVGGFPRKPAYRVEPGDRVTVILPEESELPVEPESLPLDIVYEDDCLLVVNKPAGLVVHPAPGHPDGTLVNALLAHHPPIANVGRRDRAGLVHRLDKETSGLLVVAKDEAALTALQQQFKRRKVAKTYLALVEGQLQPPEGIIEVPIGRDEKHRQRMAVAHGGKYARTLYRTTEVFADHTLLEIHPHTGRTHQIRVHLAWFGYPVVGDTDYGHRRQRLLRDRHFLHAVRLRITHPTSGEVMTFEASLPPELSLVLDRLRRRR